MKLFRALNEQDEQDYLNEKGFSRVCDKNLEDYYNKMFNSDNSFRNIKNSLDYVFNHVDSLQFRPSVSPWISTTKSVENAIREYSMPKNTEFNNEERRRPIAVIELDRIHEDKDEIAKYLYDLYIASRTFTGKKIEDFNIDLSGDRLKDFYNTQFIKPEDYGASNCCIIDEKIYNPNLNPDSKNNKEVRKMIELPESAIKASSYKEVLVYSQIPKDNIKFVLTPLMIDILYGTSKSLDDIVNNFDLVKEQVVAFYKGLTPREKIGFQNLYFPNGDIDSALEFSKNTAFINLTDLLTCKNFKIYEEYELLKWAKRGLLTKFNSKFGSPQSYARLSDDCTYVGIVDDDYDITVACKADSVILIQQGKRIIRTKKIYDMNKLKGMHVRTK